MADESSYRVGAKEVPLRRVTTAALLQPRAKRGKAPIEAAVARSDRLVRDPTVRSHCLVRGEESVMATLPTWDKVGAVRGVYLDPQGNELVMTDEVVVRFADDVTPEDCRAECRKCGVKRVRGGQGLWVVRTEDPSPDAALKLSRVLAKWPGVVYAEPNALVLPRHSAVAPPHARFPRQWHLWSDEVPPPDLRILEVWEYTRGAPSVRVVVHDTGVDASHPDLAPCLLLGKSIGDSDPGTSPNPVYPSRDAHGTAVAGVIAGGGGASTAGVVGVAPGCKVVPLRQQSAVPIDELSASLDWCAAQGEVIVCAWTLPESATMAEAFTRASTQARGGKGCVVVCAAGNNSSTPIAWPAQFSLTLPVVAVGGSTFLNALGGYTQSGPGLDVLAPSSGPVYGIETTDIRGNRGYNLLPGGDHCLRDEGSGFGGTSAAAAVVAGVAALMLSVAPGLRSDEVRAILRATANRIDASAAGYDAAGWSPTHGYGRIDALRAVAAAATMS